jgi:hypothetical protein
MVPPNSVTTSSSSGEAISRSLICCANLDDAAAAILEASPLQGDNVPQKGPVSHSKMLGGRPVSQLRWGVAAHRRGTTAASFRLHPADK